MKPFTILSILITALGNDWSITLNSFNSLLLIKKQDSQVLAQQNESVNLSPRSNQSEASQLYELGESYDREEKYDQALIFYLEAVKTFRELGDLTGAMNALYSIANIHLRQGRYEQALLNFEATIELAGRTGNLDREWRALVNAGFTYATIGQYDEAFSALEQASSIVQTFNNPLYTEKVLMRFGVVHYYLGEYDKALDFYLRALELNRQVRISGEARQEQKLSESLILMNIGALHQELHQYSQSIDYFKQALVAAQEGGRRSTEAEILNNIGFVYTIMGEPERALPFLKESLNLFQTFNDSDGLSSVLDSFGDAYTALRQYAEAWKCYQQSLSLAIGLESPSEQRNTLSNIADLLVQQNQPELAIIFYKRSVNVTESIRRDIQGLPIEQQQSYTNTVADTYRKLADLLLQQDRVLEAQRVLDLLKVQEIQDYLRRGVRGTEQTAEGIYLLEAEQQVFARFDDLLQQGSRLAELEAIPPENLTPEQREEYLQLEQTRRQIKASFNEFLDLPDVKVALEQLRVNAPQALELDALDAIRQNLAQARQDAVLLYPFVLEDRLELVVLSPNLPPIHKTVPVTRVELNHAISEFLTVLQNPESDAKPAATKLYDWIIRPIEPFLAQSGANVVLYAPDRQLRYIPLAALYDGKQWFVEKFQINQLTAVGLTSLDTPPRAQPRILAGAFSEGRYSISRRNGAYRYPFSGLPFAKVEVQTITSLFPDTRQLINQAFTEAATLPFLNSYNIIHFATHAMFATGAPDDSFIVLGNGETIDMNDIRNLSLTNVDLMVLSGCQTAVSTLDLGESLGDGVEILGFGYQVQNAGARAAIASLWSVDDGGTEVLMSQFYALLQQGNLSKAATLQQAQIALIRGEEHFQLQDALIRRRNLGDTPQLDAQQLTHPYYWAPFILIGNGL